jgi:hypothetical protein
VEGGGFDVQNIDCSRAVDLQRNKVSLPAFNLDVPISTVANGPAVSVKVGSGTIDPQTLRQASDLIDDFDSAQYSTCQAMLLVHSDDAVLTLSDRLQKQQNALAQLVRNLNSSETQQQAAVAVATAEQQKSAITAPH